jgi:hypothetical protein
MKSWKVRLALLFVLSAMLSVVSAPAMAQVDEFGGFDEFGDAEICYEIDLDYWVCDGELLVEADDFFDAEEDALEAELEEEEAEAEADADDEGIFDDDGVFDD